MGTTGTHSTWLHHTALAQSRKVNSLDYEIMKHKSRHIRRETGKGSEWDVLKQINKLSFSFSFFVISKLFHNWPEHVQRSHSTDYGSWSTGGPSEDKLDIVTITKMSISTFTGPVLRDLYSRHKRIVNNIITRTTGSLRPRNDGGKWRKIGKNENLEGPRMDGPVYFLSI